jgi:ribosomal protein S18 acetylase RimI-like enzyme
VLIEELKMLIRPSIRSDPLSMARIYVQSWWDTYLGIIPYDYLYTMSVFDHEQAFADELKRGQVICFVAEEDGRPVGFVTGGYARKTDDIYSGEIYTLYVLKSHQRRGLGAKLVSALAAELEHCDVHSMLVWVLVENPYKRFYEKINGIYLGTRQIQFAGELLDVAAYGWINTSLIQG